MYTKSASRPGLYVKPLHELVAHDRRRSASFSRVDDSDNEFEFSEINTHEPLASPKLQSFALPWPQSAASSNDDMLFIPELSGAQHQYGSAKDAGDDTIMVAASGRSIFHSGVTASADQNSQKKRVDLRSLMLERRELEQLPPLVNAGHRMNVVVADQKPTLSSSPSSSSSASSSKSSSISSTASSSPQCNLQHGKKSRRWSLKLDFLHFNRLANPSKGGVVDLRHHIDHSTATIDELGDTIHDDAADVVVGYEYAGIFECPRKSTCSLTSGNSSSAVKREKKMIRGVLSAPVSPAGSPSRVPFSPAKGSAAGHSSAKGHQAPRNIAGSKSPLSPHAHHYQQQRARAEELRRRTLLPYRQSLFGGCFFQSQVAC